MITITSVVINHNLTNVSLQVYSLAPLLCHCAPQFWVGRRRLRVSRDGGVLAVVWKWDKQKPIENDSSLFFSKNLTVSGILCIRFLIQRIKTLD